MRNIPTWSGTGRADDFDNLADPEVPTSQPITGSRRMAANIAWRPSMLSHGVRPFFLFLLVACAIAAPAAADGTVVFEDTFSAADLTWAADKDGSGLYEADGLRLLAEPGQPRLPVRDLVLLVPADRDVARAWVEPLATHREKALAPLALGEPLANEQGGLITQGIMPVDGETFPVTWGDFTGTHTWRGYRLLTITVHPVRTVNGDARDELEILDAYAVRVEYTDTRPDEDVVQRQRLVAGEAERNADHLSAVVANPSLIAGYSRQHGAAVAEPTSGFQPDKTPSLSGSAVSYLIITDEAMAPAFQALADHKTARGLPTVVATREFIAANYRNGADIQETMRMFIRDAYEKWGVEFVLLGGDSDILPPRYVDNSFYPTNGYTSIPVDLYFACLDGNWNANGNAAYGEPVSTNYTGDLADFAEEVYIGRATVSTPEMAQVFVDKIMAYEATPAGAKWPNRALFAAEVLFPSDFQTEQYIILDGAKFSHQQVVNYIEPCTDMEYMRMYETDMENPWDAQLSRAALIDTLNSGRYGIFNQIGHGYYFNMSVADANFMTTDADALVNGDNLFMIYALNCASAAFDNSCLMERFVQNPHGGSICSIGSVRAAFPNNANNYQQLFFQELYCGAANRVGELIAISRAPFLGLTSANYVDRWTFENYTLLGDPTLAIWTAEPKAAQVAAPAALQLGPQGALVTISTAGGAFEGAKVCLSKDGEDYAFGVTDVNGDVALTFSPQSAGEVELRVTGKNLAATTLMVPVVAGSAYLALDDMAVADDGTFSSAGNGDGYLDAGETIALTPTLLETGGAGAAGLSAELTCDNPGVQILTGTTMFPAVSAGGSTTAQAPLLIAIDPALDDATPLTFTLTVTSGGDVFPSEWVEVLRAPEIEVVGLDWSDDLYGNGNGLIDELERITLTVTLKNYGAGSSTALTAKLRTNNPVSVDVVDSVTTWAPLTLMTDVDGAALLSLRFQDMFLSGDTRLLIEDEYGRTLRHDFTLQRPQAPTDIVTDTSLGADVIALRWTPSVSADTYGYNIFRSEDAGGPFVRVNEDVVSGVSYYRDEGLSQLTQYYYRVATVDSSRVPSWASDTVSQATAPPELEAFPVSFADETSSPLAVGDVDGDGDPEIVLASTQVYVWHHDGLELLDGDGDSQTLGNFTDFEVGAILQPAAVTLANLDGVPGAEMIISERAPGYMIHIFNKDGDEIAGWPRSLAGPAGTKWNWAAPAVGDIDGDGDPEVVVNTLNGVVWAWHHDGTEVFDGDGNPSTVGVLYDRAGADYEWSRSGPSLYDLDGDGAKDIIFGTKNDATGTRRLMALRHDGSDVPGFPYTASDPISCNIAVGDLDNDGLVEMVFFGKFGYLYAVRQDGTNYPGFPKLTGYTANDAWVTSPALGDMDADGQLEIIYAPNYDGLTGRLIVVDTDYVGGTSGNIMNGWPVVLPGSSEASPVVGDIDGDGSPDILHGIGGGNESAPYNLYAFHANGQPVSGFPITLTGPLMNSCVITDLDWDQDVDIVYGGWDFKVHVWDMPFAFNRANVPWPTFGAGNLRDGVILPLALVGVEDPVTVPSAPLLVERPYPNPFNPSTTIRLYSDGRGEVELDIYDVQGRRVRTLHSGVMAEGWHTLVWDGRDDGGRGQSSGMYLLRARGAGSVSVQKMTLVK